jgi:hypothetical protein
MTIGVVHGALYVEIYGEREYLSVAEAREVARVLVRHANSIPRVPGDPRPAWVAGEPAVDE